MKKKYAKPEIEITAFTTEDIITASATGMERVEDVANPFEINVGTESDWKAPKP